MSYPNPVVGKRTLLLYRALVNININPVMGHL
jgi:hypothetical protein